MDADVSDGITPVRGGRIDGVEIGQVESGEEISLYITNPMLHAPFFVSFAHSTGGDGEAVVIGKIKVDGIEDRLLASHSFEHGTLQIINHDFPGNRPESLEGILMAGQEMFHGLRDGELEIHHAAVAEDHDKEAEPAAGITHGNGAVRAPVDLGALARCKGQFEERRSSAGADFAHIILEDGVASVEAFLSEALEDLDGGVGMALQHLQDGAFEGVELAGAFCRFPGHESMLCQPLGDRAGIEFQFPGDLGRGKGSLLMVMFDFAEEFEVDHDRPPIICLKSSPMARGPSMGALTSALNRAEESSGRGST